MQHPYTGEIKPCPFCGHNPERDNLIDSLYPTGMEWFKSPFLDVQWYGEDMNTIHSAISRLQVVLERDITEHGKYWSFSCLESEGGCGCTFTDLSMESVMEKWNRRVLNV